ncbi:hypothetical protein ACIBQ1_25260 [Nonomuraea sp. NPDC050153]|uniref:hypothetical protein n=1 Tax=Nonomuraea sp. NPDC050153 TaxID=3364359 RepID=UPI0037A51DE6
MQTQAGDDLIQRIRAHSHADDVVGPAANDLLSELYEGYPVGNLAGLLHSGDDSAVRTATWLLSELGELAAPMMDEIPALLAHPSAQVRFYAVEVVLVNGEARHGPTIAQVINLSTDYDTGVRWRVLGFLAAASTDQLVAGAANLAAGPVKELAEWLIRLDFEEPDPREVLARLEGPDPTARLFAAAAAGRLSEEDTGLLEHAVNAEDEEIRTFAQSWLSGSD